MYERWVNVQPNGGIVPGDSLKAFDGALAILDWEQPCKQGLALLDIPVKLWRWTQDPREWAGWPQEYVAQCSLAMFANEPDLEGFPIWYDAVCNAWLAADGKLVAPAYSKESQRAALERKDYAYYSWHAYAGNFFNRDALIARKYGKPLLGTEYGRAKNQAACPTDLRYIPEPVAIFIWRWHNNTEAGYDVAGASLIFRKEKMDTVQTAGPANIPGLSIDWLPSPNYWQGRNGMAVEGIVYHGTAGPNAAQWFQNPASQVSAHYVILKDGHLIQTVALDNSAWHAGVVSPNSPYADRPNPNYWTIGIEHERDVTNTSPITEEQIITSSKLTAWLRKQYPEAIPILHETIDVGRVCPGQNFPLDAIWNNRIQGGLVDTSTQPDVGEQQAQAYYFQHGYKVDIGHAIWTECLLPLYVEWQKLVTVHNPLADATNPGPLVSVEGGTKWGANQDEAAFVKTETGAYGVRQTPDGWLPYRLRVY